MPSYRILFHIGLICFFYILLWFVPPFCSFVPARKWDREVAIKILSAVGNNFVEVRKGNVLPPRYVYSVYECDLAYVISFNRSEERSRWFVRWPIRRCKKSRKWGRWQDGEKSSLMAILVIIFELVNRTLRRRNLAG